MTASGVRRWGPLLGALACLVLLGIVDTALKHASVTGYCPNEAQWILSTEDVGTFCSSFGRTRVGRGATKAFGSFLGDYQREVRLSTGIRPTILRWRVWMGNRLVVGSTPDGVGVSVCPGILLRATERLRRIFADVPADGDVFSYGSWYYGWRDGFLVFSASKAYVAATQQGQAITHSAARDAIQVQGPGANAFKVVFRAARGIPLSGTVRADLARGTLPLALAESWPDSPMLSVSVRKPAVLGTLAAVVWPWFKGPRSHEVLAQFESLWKRWEVPPLEAGWDANICETSLALMEVDTESNVPVPVLACIMRGTDAAQGKHPLEALTANSPVYPAEWNGVPGLRIPWLGEGLTLCLGRSGRDWLATSREPAMARLAAATRKGADTDADVALRLDWKQVGRTLSRLVPRLAEGGLLPGMDQRDTERRLGPVFEYVSELGQAAVNGRQAGEQLVFEGYLSKPGAPKP